MSEGFMKHWESNIKDPVLKRVRDKIHPEPPLKQTLTNTVYRLQVVSHKLNTTSSRLEQRAKEFFDKCAEAQMAKANDRAMMYANECAEIRKMAKIVIRSQMAVEQVILRMDTVREFGDVVTQMSPVVSILQAVKSQLVGVMPQVSYELGAIGETLNSMVIEVGETMGTSSDMVASGEEAQKILKEAGVIAEQKLVEKFPELPSALPKIPDAEKGGTIK